MPAGDRLPDPNEEHGLTIPRLLLLAILSSLPCVHCAKSSNAVQISPPLPPAEEPSDDVPGAYAPDAGTLP